MNQLHTPFTIQDGNILPEYPRPQMERKSYLNLNGVWQLQISPKKIDLFPTDFCTSITVPFSPQSILSNVTQKVGDYDYLYYQKKFVFPDGFLREKTLINFGAVDMFCNVFFNGKKVGSHVGGFHPFSVDVSDCIVKGEQTLQLEVWDVTDSSYHTTGKQSLRRGGIWYTPQSGIWQTVWCESVNGNYIQDIKITPLFDEAKVRIEVTANGVLSNLSATVYNGENKVAEETVTDGKVEISLPDFIPWSPENPHLYDIKINCDADCVKSYFGMRKYDLQTVDGIVRICLNNKPYFMNGLLDQGYWSDGMLTAPTDEALRYDVLKMKQLGFNMLRKHIKIEPLRWYYHCDKIGMIVWQDAPNGGLSSNNLIKQILPFTKAAFKDNHYWFFGRKNPASKEEFYSEYTQMLKHLQNVVSIAVWVPFNEGWGQFDAKKIVELTKKTDPTRLVDHASGLHDQKEGDIKSVHNYHRPLWVELGNRAFALTEFGGYSLRCDGHLFNLKKSFGYKDFKSKENLMQALSNLYLNQVAPLIKKGLCATVYTQVSDVEDEINGLLTFDRAVCKVDEEQMKQINSQVVYEE